MENAINKTIKNLEPSGIRQFNALADEIDDCIRFTIGEPNFNSDRKIKKAIKDAIQDDQTKYCANAGIELLREKIVDNIQQRFQVYYNKDEVIVTVGASEALSITLQTILNKDDQVIVFEPAYPAYRPIVEMNYAKYVGIDTSNNDFEIDVNILEKKITQKTKAIILTSPNNPTGHAYSKESLKAILKCIKNRNIFVICDNIYDQITYEEIPHFITHQKEREKIIIIQSFSKSYAMAGYRLGYVCADEKIIKHIVKAHAYCLSCTSTFVQHAGIIALDTDNQEMIAIYKKRMEYAYHMFKKMGILTNKPQGAFYYFLDVSKFKMNSYDFSMRLLKEAKVCVVPGRYFGEHCDQYIRLSYACSNADLKEGLNRMSIFIQTLEKELSANKKSLV